MGGYVCMATRVIELLTIRQLVEMENLTTSRSSGMGNRYHCYVESELRSVVKVDTLHKILILCMKIFPIM